MICSLGVENMLGVTFFLIKEGEAEGEGVGMASCSSSSLSRRDEKVAGLDSSASKPSVVCGP